MALLFEAPWIPTGGKRLPLPSRWSVAACDGSISLEGKRNEAEANGQKMMVNRRG
jgi:hypothetical protein